MSDDQVKSKEVLERHRPRGMHRGGGASKVKQSESGEADINQMVSRFLRTGAEPPKPGQEPRYGDFSSFETFHAAVEHVRQAELDFGALDPIVRRACDHDPGKFLEMVYDPARQKELLALGLVLERVPKDAIAPDPEKAEGDPPPPETPDIDLST